MYKNDSYLQEKLLVGLSVESDTRVRTWLGGTVDQGLTPLFGAVARLGEEIFSFLLRETLVGQPSPRLHLFLALSLYLLCLCSNALKYRRSGGLIRFPLRFRHLKYVN